MKLASFIGAIALGAASIIACSAAPEQDGTAASSEAMILPIPADAGPGTRLCGPGIAGNLRCPPGYMCSIDGIDTGHCIVIPKPKPHCNAETECTGPLRQECRICDDGTFTCAHWTCESGACAVATCPTP